MKIIRRTPRQVIKRWVAALRSGKYQQGQNRLRNGDMFCCLGVLCDLAAKDGGVQWDTRPFDRYDGERHMSPRHMTKYIGMEHDLLVEVVNLNDRGGSFKAIANIIERELL